MSLHLHQLPNGMRIVVEPMSGLKSATIGIWVAAGSRHENAEENGIAHFLEHMAFKGTRSRTALEIAESIESVGGYLNAFTGRETTAYYARVLEENVPLAFEVLSDILLDPLFDPDEIEVERGVILQEIGQVLDTPDDIVFDWLQAEAYADQPFGRSILGTADRVRNFCRADFHAFTRRHYAPSNLVLSAAGAIDPESLTAHAERVFGALDDTRCVPPSAARFTGGEKRQVKDLEQAHFALAFEAPHATHSDVYVCRALSLILGGGMSSRLFQEAREKRGLCYAIYADSSAASDCGTLGIYAGTSGDDLPELINITMDEMKRAGDDISVEEVARARTQMKAGLVMGLEAPSARAERNVRLLQLHGRVPDIDETVDEIEAVSVDRVRGVAADLVANARAAMALYGPVEKAPALAHIMHQSAA